MAFCPLATYRETSDTMRASLQRAGFPVSSRPPSLGSEVVLILAIRAYLSPERKAGTMTTSYVVLRVSWTCRPTNQRKVPHGWPWSFCQSIPHTSPFTPLVSCSLFPRAPLCPRGPFFLVTPGYTLTSKDLELGSTNKKERMALSLWLCYFTLYSHCLFPSMYLQTP